MITAQVGRIAHESWRHITSLKIVAAKQSDHRVITQRLFMTSRTSCGVEIISLSVLSFYTFTFFFFSFFAFFTFLLFFLVATAVCFRKKINISYSLVTIFKCEVQFQKLIPNALQWMITGEASVSMTCQIRPTPESIVL